MLYFHHQKPLEVGIMKGINKLGKIITKILEVFHWVGTILMAAATVCSVAAPNWVKYFVGFDAKECCGNICCLRIDWFSYALLFGLIAIYSKKNLVLQERGFFNVKYI